MATEIRVPALGESVTEATVGQWFKKAGDSVNADEPLVELETDKVTVEVPAPASGVLGEIKAAAGHDGRRRRGARRPSANGAGGVGGEASSGGARACCAGSGRQSRSAAAAQGCASSRCRRQIQRRDAAEPRGAQEAGRGRPRRRRRRRLRQARPDPEGGRARSTGGQGCRACACAARGRGAGGRRAERLPSRARCPSRCPRSTCARRPPPTTPRARSACA